MRCNFSTVAVNEEHKIVFVEDANDGGTTITNDAEAAYDYLTKLYGFDHRVVYQDTDGEWWEIIGIRDYTNSHHPREVLFKPWHGLSWDILSRKNNETV